VSVERASRFVVAWASGPRDETLAEKIVTATRDRTGASETITVVTDGWEAYETAVKRAYWEREGWEGNPNWAILKPTDKVRLTQAVKHREGRRLAHVEIRATVGPPAELPDAVHLERLNGTLRDRLGCLTRKTHAFAKAIATWDALLSLALFAHNWIRPHIALRRPLPEPIDGLRYERRSPAMALGLADHLWSWEEFLHLSVRQRRTPVTIARSVGLLSRC
jgi:IS1 family transposase